MTSKKISELDAVASIDGNYYFIVDNGTAAYKFNYNDLQIAAATPSLEAIYDAIASSITAGTGISVSSNDGSNTTTITNTITQYTDEMARDALGSAIIAGSGILVSVDDNSNTITLTSQYAATPIDEAVRDIIGATLVAGTGMTVTVNDAANTITLASSGSYTSENARDDIGAALVAGGGISINVNDPADTITISSIYAATPLGQSSTPNLKTAFYSSGWPARPFSETTLWISSDRAATPPTAALNTDIVILPPPLEVWEFALSDEATPITTGVKLTWRTPAAITLVNPPRSSLTTASSSGVVTVDINETGSTIMTNNKLSIDANEKTSVTAATPCILTDTSLADDAEITFNITTAGTGATGLKVKLYGFRT